MSDEDFTAAFIGLTDAQFNALVVRRAQAKEQRRREQSAARSRKYRGTERHADHHDTVTQENRDSTSERHAKRHDVVTQEIPDKPSPPPQVSPTPPSSPASTPAPIRAKEAAPKPESVSIPPLLAEIPRFEQVWHNFIDMRRIIKEPMTHHAAEIALSRIAKRPHDAVALLELFTERQWYGLRWGLFDEERAKEGVPTVTATPKPDFSVRFTAFLGSEDGEFCRSFHPIPSSRDALPASVHLAFDAWSYNNR